MQPKIVTAIQINIVFYYYAYYSPFLYDVVWIHVIFSVTPLANEIHINLLIAEFLSKFDFRLNSAILPCYISGIIFSDYGIGLRYGHL